MTIRSGGDSIQETCLFKKPKLGRMIIYIVPLDRSLIINKDDVLLPHGIDRVNDSSGSSDSIVVVGAGTTGGCCRSASRGGRRRRTTR